MYRRTSYLYNKKTQARRPRWGRIGAVSFVLVSLVVLIVWLIMRCSVPASASGQPAAAASPSPLASVATSPSPSSSPAISSAASPLPSDSPTPSPLPSVSPTQTPVTTNPSPSPSSSPQSAANAPDAQTASLLKQARSAFGSKQVVVVLATGNQAQVALYEQSADGTWAESVRASGRTGRNGVSSARKEGDGTTPTGIYKLGFAFGNSKNPGTKLAYRNVTGQSYWVDDSSSQYYNQWVEGTANKDWDSAEVLAQAQTSYAYAIVVEYNYGSATVAGKGSAIFLHCGSSPTSGCVAIEQGSLVSMLKRLDPDNNPSIAIAKKA